MTTAIRTGYPAALDGSNAAAPVPTGHDMGYAFTIMK
jgi:hypothetical protein